MSWLLRPDFLMLYDTQLCLLDQSIPERCYWIVIIWITANAFARTPAMYMATVEQIVWLLVQKFWGFSCRQSALKQVRLEATSKDKLNLLLNLWTVSYCSKSGVQNHADKNKDVIITTHDWLCRDLESVLLAWLFDKGSRSGAVSNPIHTGR